MNQINKYQNGQIYELVNLINGMKYKGSTIKELNNRKIRHDAASNLGTSPLYIAMQQYGCANFRILLVKNYPCNSKHDLEMEETRVIAAAKTAGEVLYNVAKPAVATTPAIIAKRIRDINNHRAHAGKFCCHCCNYAADRSSNLKAHLNSRRCKAKMPAFLLEQEIARVLAEELKRFNDIEY